MASPDDTPQQGLDSCYEAYGDKVIGFSFDSGFGTGEYSCYFDPNDMPVIAGGWSVGYESSDADPPVGGGNGSPASICYNFRAQTCSSRIVAAVDRTYTFKYPGPAIQVARSAYRMVAFLINALPFDEDVRFGLLDIDRTSIDWRVDLDDAAATDPTLLLEDVFRAHASLNAGSRALGSKFPPVFTSVAEKVVSESAEIPSYIVLVSDGVLLHPSRWRNYAKLKQRMLNRLGDAAPKVICYRMYRLQNTKFFDAVCDETFYAGMDGKSLTEITEDIAAEICPLLGDDNGDGPGASDGSELGASSTSRESVDMQPVVDRGPNDA